jgi:hypothetical protein
MWFSISTRSVAPRVFPKRRALDEIAAQQRTADEKRQKVAERQQIAVGARLAVVQ